jgi:lipopolysaccharide biosynthesis protein
LFVTLFLLLGDRLGTWLLLCHLPTTKEIPKQRQEQLRLKILTTNPSCFFPIASGETALNVMKLTAASLCFFFAMPTAISEILALGLNESDIPNEPLPYDGTVLHALERLVGLVPKAAGLSSKAINHLGTTR